MSLKQIRAVVFFMSATTAVAMLNSCSSPNSDLGPGASTGETTNGGGVGGSGFLDLAVGDITGFGSVSINGVTYDTSNTGFTINGLPAMQSDLRIGMNVTAAVNFQEQAAGSISYMPIVLGPVATTSLEVRTFEILGQTVVVDSTTVLDDVSLDVNASNVIAEGAIIEVSGIRNADNDIVASYIRRNDSATRYQVLGLPELENIANQELLIDGLLLDLSGIDPDQFTIFSGGGAVLFFLESEGTSFTVSDSAPIPIPTTNEFLMTSGGSQIQAEGYIRNNQFGEIFEFDDLQVIVDENTIIRFVDGRPATSNDLGANSRIELVATITGDGVVTADQIIIIEP